MFDKKRPSIVWETNLKMCIHVEIYVGIIYVKQMKISWSFPVSNTRNRKIDHLNGMASLICWDSLVAIIHNDPDDESMIVGINVVIAVMMMMIAFSLALAPVDVVVSSMIVIQCVVMTYPDTSTPPITKYVIRY